MLILDIPCQQFGDKCKLEGFFVPFGHRDGKCIFIEIYIYIGYMLPTIWRACYTTFTIFLVAKQLYKQVFIFNTIFAHNISVHENSHGALEIQGSKNLEHPWEI